MSKSDLTRQRILDAATIEFAAHGFAGARMDRIADTAPANKSQIYAYFGDKEKLFDITLERALANGAHAITVDEGDLPEYAGALHDHLQQHPELFRLALWRQLERPHSTAPTEAESWEHKRLGVAAQRGSGEVLQNYTASEVLALVLAITQTWHLAPEALTAGEDPSRRRHVIVRAVRRLIGDTSAST